MSAQRLVVATGNPGKLREIRALLDDPRIELVTDPRVDMATVEETGATFVENALLKARYASHRTSLPAIADDSGIVVDALHGAPGIRSARYADGLGDDANNRKLLEALSDVPDAQRIAHFLCVIVVLRHADDPAPLVCEGRWPGRIAHSLHGEGGFGYDPLFLPDGLDCTSAELSAAEKNRLSHRGQALDALRQRLPGFLAGSE